MQKFENFIFKKFEFDYTNLKAKFFYSFDNLTKFVEEIDFKSDSFKIRKDLDKEVLSNFLFALFIASWISYYKLFPTKNLIIEEFELSEQNLQFWKKFYINWLWEFFYKNNINPNWLCNFVSKWNITYKKIKFKQSNRILLPIWWWKDSLVSAEILGNNNFWFTPFVFWKIDLIKENCIKIIWKKEILVKRKLDENLFRLNQLWYYNWHIPITWIISFVLLTTAYLYDYRYIVLSNEKSANTWNLKLEINRLENKKELWEENYKKFLKSEKSKDIELGIIKSPLPPLQRRKTLRIDRWELKFLEINHQYSKSLEFEKDLNNYIKWNLSDEIIYFSLLRWMYEIKIAEIFSKVWKKYFSVFSSCNKNFKIRNDSSTIIYQNDKMNLENNCSVKKTKYFSLNSNLWCLDCPKCAFVYAILKAFLSDKEILQIFSGEMYEDKKQENLFKELLWIQWIKPFECVWEKEEVAFAMNKTINNLQKDKKELPIILKNLEEKIKLKDDGIMILQKKLFKNYIDETLIPDEFQTIIWKYFN